MDQKSSIATQQKYGPEINDFLPNLQSAGYPCKNRGQGGMRIAMSQCPCVLLLYVFFYFGKAISHAAVTVHAVYMYSILFGERPEDRLSREKHQKSVLFEN